MSSNDPNAVPAGERQPEERYRQLVEALSEMLYTLDAEGRITSLNRAFETLTGEEIGAWLGRPFTDLLLPDGEQGSAGIAGAYRMRGANGAVLELETSIQPLVPGDPAQGTIGLARDVTARNAAARRLDESRRLASLGKLAGMMAHEMNNILMGILPYCDLLIRQAGETKLAATARRSIDATIARGRRITSEMLEYTDPKKPEPRPIDPGPWMAGATALLEPLLANGVTLDVRNRLQEPLLADPEHLEQILTNLAINAVHAMPNGGVLALELEEAPSGAPDPPTPGSPTRLARLTVRDTGSGIRPDVLAQIFEPLFSTKRGGTGLGLSIVKRLVELQGGAVTVESAEGTGTAVHLSIPMAPAG